MKVKALQSAWDAVKDNKEFLPHLESLNSLQLEEIKKNRHLGINNVRIVASGPGGRICSCCSGNGNSIKKLDTELKQQTLPHKECSCTAYEDHQTGFCLCYYEIVFDDEV